MGLERGENEKLRRSFREHLEVMCIFIILIMVMISQVYICQNVLYGTLSICAVYFVIYISINLLKFYQMCLIRGVICSIHSINTDWILTMDQIFLK